MMSSIEQIQSEAAQETQAAIGSLVTDDLLKSVIQRYYDLRVRNGDELAPLKDYSDLAGIRQALRAAADFRTGPGGEYRERWDIEDAAEASLHDISDDLVKDIHTVSSRHGLVGNTTFQNPHKAAGIVLGAGGSACLDRSKYMVRQLRSGALATDRFIGLASQRPVDEKERLRAGAHASEAETEEDLMRFGMSSAFNIDPEAFEFEQKIVEASHSDVPNVQRIGRLAVGGVEIYVISAAVITDPYMKNGKLRNRANTTDSMVTAVSEELILPGDEVGVVTHAIYKPFQGSDARNVLGSYGVRAEVIGFDPSEFGRPAKKLHELMQEILTLADRLQ